MMWSQRRAGSRTTPSRSRSQFTPRMRCIGFASFVALLLPLLLGLLPPAVAQAAGASVNVILTTTDQQNKLTPKSNLTFAAGNAVGVNVVTVDESLTYQPIEGFGASFTDSSVWMMTNKQNATQRAALMSNLFHPTNGIGMTMLRQPMGGSDQNAPGQLSPNVFCSYDDNGGTPDPTLANFSIAHDLPATIPLLQQAKQLNGQLKILGTPWCIPQWMLQPTGGAFGRSIVSPTYYNAYANYFVKYAQAYAAQGLPIWGISLQNEPYGGIAYGNNLTAGPANTIIRDHLGPALASNNLSPKIIIYDHNWDLPEYPELILNDPVTRNYVAGTAWHYYGGAVSAQTRVNNAFPEKGTYYTEASSAPQNTNWSDERYLPYYAKTYIDIMRNWSRTLIMFTIASNPQFGPGACTYCGAIVYIDDGGNVTYSFDYYLLGHFSKYVKLGAQRIASENSGTIRNVAFKNPDGTKALVAYNESASTQTMTVQWGGETFSYSMPGNAVATFTWSGSPTATPAKTVVTVDNKVMGTGTNQFNYTGSGWAHCTSNCGTGSFHGDSNSYSVTTNDAATLAFNGTQIKFYGKKAPWAGQVAVSIDGGPETILDTYAREVSENVLHWMSPQLAPGNHTFRARVTGTTSGGQNWVDVDRVDIIGGTTGGGTPSGPPIGKTIWLKANANNRYVSAWNDVNRTLQARVDAVGTWERFQVVDAGGGFVALRALINNQYVSAWNDPNRTLQARVTWIGDWEKFQWIDAGGGFIALKANVNGQYVSAWNDPDRTLQARIGAIGEWEKFTWAETP